MFARRDLLTSAFGLGALALLPLPVLAQDSAAATDKAAVQIADMTMGSPDAPVKVVEYASFTCPHCAHFAEDVFKQIKANYIDTGKVQFTLREVYFDRYGLWASMIARCGGEMRFYGIADRLFATQSDWARGNDPAAIADNLRRIGLTAGLSQDQLDACLNDNDTAQALVAWYQKNAQDDDVKATPSFMIDGEPYSNMSYEEFAKVLDEKLAS